MSGAKIKIKVGAVRVLDESNELSDSDEPYIIVFVVDTSTNLAGFTVPNARTTVFSWNDADEGELLTTLMDDQVPEFLKKAPLFVKGSDYCWGPAGKPVMIDNADQLVILAGIMENDDGNPAAGRALVNGMMAGALANVAGSGLNRNDLVKRLKNDMDGALTQARMTGAPDFDDRVGPVLELRLTQADLDQSKTATVRKNLTFNGGDANGAYRVGFDLVPG